MNIDLERLRVNADQRILLKEDDFDFFEKELKKPAKEPSEYSLRALDEFRKMFKSDVRDKI